MNSKLLKVITVGAIVDTYQEGHKLVGQSITDATGKANSYRAITFQSYEVIDGKEVFSMRSNRTRNIWKNTNEQMFNSVKPGMLIKGSIEQVQCDSYEVSGRIVNSVTFVVFDGETIEQSFNSTQRGRISVNSTSVNGNSQSKALPGTAMEADYNEDLGQK